MVFVCLVRCDKVAGVTASDGFLFGLVAVCNLRLNF